MTYISQTHKLNVIPEGALACLTFVWCYSSKDKCNLGEAATLSLKDSNEHDAAESDLQSAAK